ncbi:MULTISPECIES: trans-sulfuration enzyme family protein [Candidatus Microthrix]|jgi:cystathionine beta-lyase/cystathionine gamma-synthase|uniref:homocysteine desulfhydrase n=1 Tax=Candidatus Neomicrothrix parvicella RN1 TaxID=1229780 RepID=R4Z576_9ACTN|nr:MULTISPECIES: aminotransferase class I/II-fold pyridoxal phosphate-dependent enzyme [Microthrix]NLH65872.1 aminotransferase class I/II-fold pyridoxal phosphate-dependent enzyme [Candidatus Microthrix parvicella]MBK7020937.1 aminotransferase class I/II-fold pyridoxal phosphate-dependent enzyme [Candidatus Microthrix sp.]MBK7321646.1 aminotransferase class I/II-fold pyridoxal phosphate-dependent enzyme [Candidatus Microthrix sp.]MBL0204032.1 aminotransferase class I/II-fold pyridoxal phosphate
MTDHLETRAILAGRPGGDADLAPVMHPSTTFELESVDEGRAMATSTGSTTFYSRYGNPSVAAFESAVADLEGAEAARAFASGMGAMAAVVLGLCSTGDHIVTQNRLYAGTQMLFSAVCPRFGIEVTSVDGADPDAWEAAIRPGKTMLCVAETPANPRLELVDLERFGAIAGPMCVVDSTFATPLAQRPLEHGVDLVVHSATKAMSGHNDASLGVVVGSRELLDWVWGFAVLQGANASPFDAVNGLRGLRTLGVRLTRQSATADRLAHELLGHGEVSEVLYPGLPSFPQAELAKRQMDLCGGLLTIELEGGLEAGRRFVESTRIARLAPSLGGPETLVTHPASTTHVSLFPEEQVAAGIGPGTVRISVGLEHPDDLVADILAALDACRN